MSWFSPRSQNRLRRHDLKRLDGMLRTRLRQQRQVHLTAVAVMVVLALVGAGWGAWFLAKQGARHLFSENPAYRIKEITVESSGPALRREYVRTYLRLQTGQNLLALDLAQLRLGLESLPMVERAEIVRELPSRLAIRITERVPVANILAENGLQRFQIDGQGMVMNLSEFEKNSDELKKQLRELPRITGARVNDLRVGRAVVSPEIAQAIALIRQMEKTELSTGLDVKEIDVSRRGMLTLSAMDGALVKVGLASVNKQLKRLAVILNDARQRSLRVATVDLTVERDVPVTFASAQ